MKLWKRAGWPLVVMVALGAMVGCEKPLAGGSPEEYGAGLSAKDREALAQKREREEASAQLADGLLRVSQAMTLAQNGLQLKLHGASSLDGPAAPTAVATAPAPVGPQVTGAEPPAAVVEPAEPGAPAAAEQKPPRAGIAGAAQPDAPPAAEVKPEGAPAPASAEPAAPQPPEIIPQGSLAIQLVDQAYANLLKVKADMKPLLDGKFKDEPRVKALAELLDVAEKLILAAARMEPANADLLAVVAAEAQKAAAAAAAPAPSAAPSAPAAEPAAPAPAAPTAPSAPAAAPTGELSDAQPSAVPPPALPVPPSSAPVAPPAPPQGH